MSKILILGGTGMLGHQLCKELSKNGNNRVATTVRKDKSVLEAFSFFQKIKVYGDVHISEDNFLSLEKTITEFEPDIVINALGQFPRMDNTGQDLNLINSILPHKIYDICRSVLKKYYIITISTDGVFSGTKGSYRENDYPDATDPYGVSKILGELNEEHALTIRTSMYGRDPLSHKGLLEWFLHSEKDITGYTNVYFSGVSTIHLSKVVAAITQLAEKPSGVLHVHTEKISKYDLLNLFKKYFSVGINIIPQDNPIRDMSLVSERELFYNRESHDQMIRYISQSN